MKPTYEELEQQLAAVVAENAGLPAPMRHQSNVRIDRSGTGSECGKNGLEVVPDGTITRVRL